MTQPKTSVNDTHSDKQNKPKHKKTKHRRTKLLKNQGNNTACGLCRNVENTTFHRVRVSSLFNLGCVYVFVNLKFPLFIYLLEASVTLTSALALTIIW